MKYPYITFEINEKVYKHRYDLRVEMELEMSNKKMTRKNLLANVFEVNEETGEYEYTLPLDMAVFLLIATIYEDDIEKAKFAKDFNIYLKMLQDAKINSDMIRVKATEILFNTIPDKDDEEEEEKKEVKNV